MPTASLTFFNTESSGNRVRLSYQDFDISRYQSFKVSRAGNTITITFSALKKFASSYLTVKTTNKGRFKSVVFAQQKQLGEIFNIGNHWEIPCFVEIESPMVAKLTVIIPAEAFIRNDLKLAA